MSPMYYSCHLFSKSPSLCAGWTHTVAAVMKTVLMEKTINSHSRILFFFSPFPITVFQKVSLRKNTICLCEANIIEHNLLSYLDLLCSSYNLPARHKLNLHCFLWLTIEHKFNRPLIQGFSFPLTRGQCKTLFWSHDCQPLWLQTTLALSAEVDVGWCLKSTIALIRHCSHVGVNLGSEKKE